MRIKTKVIIGIYKITSPSKKVYIGQSRDILRRFRKYKNLDCRNQIKLYRSIKKYGIENHKLEILEECEFNLLNIRERYWQDCYNVTGLNGLNFILTRTDLLPTTYSEETRRKMSESSLKRFSKIPKKQKIKPIKVYKSRKGKIISKEHRIINAKAASKSIICVISGKQYDSIQEAVKDTGFSLSYLYKMISGFQENKSSFIYNDFKEIERIFNKLK